MGQPEARRRHRRLARRRQLRPHLAHVRALEDAGRAPSQPWRADVRFGAVRDGEALCISLAADQPWAGPPGLRSGRGTSSIMHLPLDYPRINQFPEWFTVQAGARYQVSIEEGKTQKRTGDQLAKGIPVELKAGQASRHRGAGRQIGRGFAGRFAPLKHRWKAMAPLQAPRSAAGRVMHGRRAHRAAQRGP